MKRLLTAAVAVPLALLAVFRLPAPWLFSLALGIILLSALEYVRLTRRWAGQGPLWLLLLLVPVAALAMSPDLVLDTTRASGPHLLLLSATVLSIGLGSLVLVARTPVAESMPALGILAFGLPYFALPVASIYHLRQHDPWVLFLMLAIVWLGDTAAYYCGTNWGRRPMAPVVSPKKTWVGAVAGLVAGILVAGAWSLWRLGELNGPVLILAALTSGAAQLGDLVESMIKRGAEVKDSGNLLPGHGGVWDRMDATLFAAPVMLLGVRLLGDGALVP